MCLQNNLGAFVVKKHAQSYTNKTIFFNGKATLNK